MTLQDLQARAGEELARRRAVRRELVERYDLEPDEAEAVERAFRLGRPIDPRGTTVNPGREHGGGWSGSS
jgi:hypothetical protein